MKLTKNKTIYRVFSSIFIYFVLFLFGLAVIPYKGQAQSSMMTLQNCQGSFCTNVISSLAQGATGVDPNTTVNLNFSITLNAGQNASNCTNSSYQLFHAIKHVSGSSYEYLASGNGAGPAVDYTFNSMAAGNQNDYVGIFYCWKQQLNDKSSIDSILSSGVSIWQTPEFNVTTRTAAANPTEYGCAAATGVYTCTTDQNNASIQQACSSANATFGTVTPSDKCGCTDQTYSAGTCKNGSTTGTGTSSSSSNMANNSGTTLYNPITGVNDLTSLLITIMKGFLGILAVWAVVFIVVGGFRMVISSGNEEQVTAAKKTITWAILGLVIAVLSFAIIAIVQNLIGVNVQAPPAGTTQNISTGEQNK